MRRIGIGGWTIELFRRRTVLADRYGVVAALWEKVHPRGHAAEVLNAALALERVESGGATSGPLAPGPGERTTPR